MRACVARFAVAVSVVAGCVLAVPGLASAVSSNDRFGSARTIDLAPQDLDDPSAIRGQDSNIGAALEAGEPTACGDVGATLWYRVDLHSPSALDVYASPGYDLNGPAGPAFTMDIALYSGTSLETLNLLDCSTSDGRPSIAQDLAAGTYWLQVGGEQAATGNFQITFFNVLTGNSLVNGQGGDLSGALVDDASCTANQLPANDDGSSTQVNLPFNVNFYGNVYNSLWVNNNGNVTFNGPQSTYTPYGIVGSTEPIIAPFFADVDTRASGSGTVQYGYGTTLFQGHPAFCVDWFNVGYYSDHSDKLDSFQLLLVDRSDVAPGAFDIVFNYGSLQWETGDASDGVDGLGGASARAGFSNGGGSSSGGGDGGGSGGGVTPNVLATTAATTTGPILNQSFELPGSGVNGALLDSAPTGLIHNHLGADQDGRYIFPVRGGAAPNTYVAMGDSYSSGQGAGDYESTGWNGTDSATDGCHRSPHSYAGDIVAAGLPYAFTFVACSGATTDDVILGKQDSNHRQIEPSQLDALGPDTALVTLGVGGDNLKFANVLSDCLYKDPAAAFFPLTDCWKNYGSYVDTLQSDLAAPDPATGLTPIDDVLAQIHQRAPQAHVVVVGYPRIFPEDPSLDWSSVLSVVTAPFAGEPRCQGIRMSDQIWIDGEEQQLNRTVETAARTMGADFVDLYDTSSGTELCAGGAETFFNGITPSDTRESFHPDAYGYLQETIKIESSVSLGPDPSHLGATFYGLAQDQSMFTTRNVPAGTPSASFNTSWPGSDIEMSLVSPSGQLYTRTSQTPDVFHANGPTSETYVITDPEPGTWTIKLYGAQISASAGDSEPVSLTTYDAPASNTPPVAVASMQHTGDTVTFSAAGSNDPDGTIASYLWDFGDGATATGPTATHTYAPGQTLSATLVVTDNGGAKGYGETAEFSTPLVPAVDVQLSNPSPLFGQPLSAVASVNPPTASNADAPTGSVTFLDGSTTLATVPLTGGHAELDLSSLQGGNHVITAQYSGDTSYTGAASAPAPLTIGWSTPCITTRVNGPLTIASGQSICLGAGAVVNGPVRVDPGGALSVHDASIHGPLTAHGATALSICGSTITGPVSAADSTGFVLIGAPHNDCAANAVNGPLTLTGNSQGAHLEGNIVHGPVSVNANSAGGLMPYGPVPLVGANTISGPLQCATNTPTVTTGGAPNTATGPISGQCATG